MTSTSPDPPVAPVCFDVLPVPIGSYQKPGHAPLPVQAEVSEVLNLFAELGLARLKPLPPDHPLTETEIGESLADWAESYSSRSGNSVLYWVGHGAYNGTDAWLACRETRSPIRDGMAPSTLAGKLREEWGRRQRDEDTWTMLVVEACGAGMFVELLNSELGRGSPIPERLLLVGVGGEGQTELGHFQRSLRATLNAYTDNDDPLPLERFANDLGRRLEQQGTGVVHQRKLYGARPLPRRQPTTGSITAPVDIYSEMKHVLAGLSDDIRGHFLPKAQGAEHGELAWHFVGREQERRDILRWLCEQQQGLLIVTGRAGSGKSALLGNVVAHTHPPLREILIRAGHLEALPAEQLPAADPFDAVLHLTGATIGELTGQLVAAAGLSQAAEDDQAVRPDPSTSAAAVSSELEWLLEQLAARDQPFTVLADALDEAQDPLTIASALFRRLSALPGVRVLVGTRASTLEGPDQPDTDDENLLDALASPAGAVQLLEVRRDPQAIQTYVRRRLTAARDRLAADDDTLRGVATAVRLNNDQEFLFARLLVHEVIARPELLAPPLFDTELAALIGSNHRGLFAAAVDRLSAVSVVFEPMLAALALGRGRGLPRADRIWAIVAEALTEPAQSVTEDDIDRLLEAAAPYIMLDREDGQSVYRLSHRTFQELFRARLTGS